MDEKHRGRLSNNISVSCLHDHKTRCSRLFLAGDPAFHSGQDGSSIIAFFSSSATLLSDFFCRFLLG